jgi:TPR repeat protein
VEQSNAYAVKWYRKAAEQGNAEACYQLGMSYYKAEGVFQDFVEARHWLQKSDFSKHNDAALMLASFFRTGTGGPADSAMAAKYQQIAAENGDAASLYSLAVQYYNGTGKEQNDAKAFELFLKAAEMNHAESQFMTGCCYYYGTGVAKDKEKGEYWIGRARENGVVRDYK